MLRSVKLQEHVHHCTSITLYDIFVVIVEITHISYEHSCGHVRVILKLTVDRIDDVIGL
jgi:hypothetical protein